MNLCFVMAQSLCMLLASAKTVVLYKRRKNLITSNIHTFEYEYTSIREYEFEFNNKFSLNNYKPN